MRQTVIVIVAAMLIGWAPPAGAAPFVVIDFDDVPPGTVLPVHTEDGFDVVWGDPPGLGTPPGVVADAGTFPLAPDSGTPYGAAFGSFAPPAPPGFSPFIIIARTDGGIFTFHGFDAAGIPSFGSAGILIDVSGIRPETSFYFDSFLFDGVSDGFQRLSQVPSCH